MVSDASARATFSVCCRNEFHSLSLHGHDMTDDDGHKRKKAPAPFGSRGGVTLTVSR